MGRMSMLRFSIRELLLITLCVGICIAWWLDRKQLAYSVVNATNKQAEAEGNLKDATDHILNMDLAVRREGFGWSKKKTGQKRFTLHRLDPIYGDR